jgi:branched-chain amino acid transport system substrate-binding protein
MVLLIMASGTGLAGSADVFSVDEAAPMAGRKWGFHMGQARNRARRSPRLLLAALAVLAVALAACSSSPASSGSGSAGAAKSPFVIVIDTGTTGPYGANGSAAVEGVKAAANVLNATQGGILGHKVVVQVLDNQGNPTTAATLLEQRLASGTKPNMIEPGSISSEGVVEVPIAAAAKILSIGTPNDSSLNNPAKYPYEFLMAPSAILPQESLMNYFKAHHYTRAAMIYSSDAYGASVGASAIQAAKQAGITLATATYQDTDLNMTSQLQKLQASKPQVLYVQGFAAPPGIILQDLYTLGWKIPTIGDLTTGATPLIAADAAKPQEKGLLLQNLKIGVYSASQPTAVKNYITALQKFGPITSLLNTTSYQYDSVMVAAQAAKQANSIATPAMANAIEHLKQPASPPWVTLSQYIFTTTDHAPSAALSNWVVAPVSPLTNGQYDGPAS